ncbi:MAG: CBS domain-containing protein [Phormidesmis sp.]
MLTVADIMTAEVFTVRSSATIAQTIALMQKNQVRSLVVERDFQGGIYGIITERDIVYRVTAAAKDPISVRVGEIMQKPCISVEPHLSLPAVAQQLAEAGIQRAPVIENDQLVGIISITDIVMKSNVEAVILPDDLSRRIETALRHKRLSWNKENQIEQESAIAWDVMEELRSEVPHV